MCSKGVMYDYVHIRVLQHGDLNHKPRSRSRVQVNSHTLCSDDPVHQAFLREINDIMGKLLLYACKFSPHNISMLALYTWSWNEIGTVSKQYSSLCWRKKSSLSWALILMKRHFKSSVSWFKNQRRISSLNNKIQPTCTHVWYNSI